MALHTHNTSHVFNTDMGTGKSIPRSNFGDGMAAPTQFNRPPQFDGAVGSTSNLGPVFGGGMGKANNDAGKAVGRMPNIPLGAIFGS